jgi:hypothetical protein
MPGSTGRNSRGRTVEQRSAVVSGDGTGIGKGSNPRTGRQRLPGGGSRAARDGAPGPWHARGPGLWTIAQFPTNRVSVSG